MWRRPRRFRRSRARWNGARTAAHPGFRAGCGRHHRGHIRGPAIDCSCTQGVSRVAAPRSSVWDCTAQAARFASAVAAGLALGAISQARFNERGYAPAHRAIVPGRCGSAILNIRGYTIEARPTRLRLMLPSRHDDPLTLMASSSRSRGGHGAVTTFVASCATTPEPPVTHLEYEATSARSKALEQIARAFVMAVVSCCAHRIGVWRSLTQHRDRGGKRAPVGRLRPVVTIERVKQIGLWSTSFSGRRGLDEGGNREPAGRGGPLERAAGMRVTIRLFAGFDTQDPLSYARGVRRRRSRRLARVVAEFPEMPKERFVSLFRGEHRYTGWRGISVATRCAFLPPVSAANAGFG